MYYIGIVLMLIEKAQKKWLEQIEAEEARDDRVQLYIDTRWSRWDELESLKYDIKSYLTETAISNKFESREKEITLKAVVPDDKTVYGYEIKIKTVGIWPVLSTEEIQELIKALTFFADLTGMDGCEVEVIKEDLNNS